MDRVDEPIALRLFGVLAVILRVGQKAGRHAWPEGEDDEGNEVAHGHGPPPLLVDMGAESAENGTPSRRRHALRLCLLQLAGGPGCGEIEEDDEEEDRSRDMDEGVDSVRP